MKRTFFSILIILLTTTLMFGLTSNDNFAMMWETAQSYEKKSQPESALAIVNKICKKAEKEKNEGQYIKALIYRQRLNLEKYGDDKTDAYITELENAISTGKFTECGTALLHLLADAPEPLSLNRFARLGRLPRHRAVQLLAQFIRFGIVKQQFINHTFVYVATEEGE